MKSCPTCNRTYSDDTFTFCLSDGALLSAPYDPQATLVIPARDTDPRPAIDRQPTSPPESPELAPTMAALPLLERRIERPRTEAAAEDGMSGATVATIVVLLLLSVVLTVFLSRC